MLAVNVQLLFYEQKLLLPLPADQPLYLEVPLLDQCRPWNGF